MSNHKMFDMIYELAALSLTRKDTTLCIMLLTMDMALLWFPLGETFYKFSTDVSDKPETFSAPLV